MDAKCLLQFSEFMACLKKGFFRCGANLYAIFRTSVQEKKLCFLHVLNACSSSQKLQPVKTDYLSCGTNLFSIVLISVQKKDTNIFYTDAKCLLRHSEIAACSNRIFSCSANPYAFFIILIQNTLFSFL